jgi:hypothetical protein
MNRVKLIIILCFLVVSLTSCKQETEGQKPIAIDNNVKQDENKQPQKNYFGMWEIKKVVAYNKIHAGGAEEIIGNRLTYSSKIVTYDNESL